MPKRKERRAEKAKNQKSSDRFRPKSAGSRFRDDALAHSESTGRGAKAPHSRGQDSDSGGSGGFRFVDRTGRVHFASKRAQAQAEGAAQPAHAPSPHAGGKIRPKSESILPDHPSMRQKHKAKKGMWEPETDLPPARAKSTRGESHSGPGRGHGHAGAGHGPSRYRDEKPTHREGDSGRDRRPGRPDRAQGPSYGRPSEPHRRAKARVEKNRRGFGFLIFEDRSLEDTFLPPRDAERLFHGDRVEVALSSDRRIVGIQVLEHRFRELVGRFQPKGREGGLVVYERKSSREEIWIPKPMAGVKPNDWVQIKLVFDNDDARGSTGEITKIYGQELPASADIGMVASEYNLVEEHPAEAEREARSFTLETDLKNGRKDLRHVPFITIDGETARDFDDAIYVEKKKSGFILWVAIADVSHYVTPGSALDASAKGRGTSVYFPEKAFHMLPRALSENLCSLRPNEPRLAMVAKMEFDHQGERLHTELMDALIESRRRATYNEIQAEWEQNQKNKDWEFASHFALYQIIRKTRSDRGSIDFDLPESEIRVNEAGDVQWIRLRERQDAHRLIEEFMIAANEAVTDWINERKWPFLYRIHEEPSEQALQKFQKLAATVGVQVSLDKPGQSLSQVLNAVVAKLGGHPASVLLNMALLRSMRQAIYSASHDIHFGLASEGYTHFTSPIRRYPDLVVHRMLRMALRVEQEKTSRPPSKELDRLDKELHDVAEHCSYRERLASEAERESIRLKQIRAMIPRVGDEFTGKINGMMEAGFFVQIFDPYVEGMVTQENLNDDFYQFNEERMIFYGTRKRRTFRIGQEVGVRVLRASIDERKIDLGLLDTTEAAPATEDETLAHQARRKTAKTEKPGKKFRPEQEKARRPGKRRGKR